MSVLISAEISSARGAMLGLFWFSPRRPVILGSPETLFKSLSRVFASPNTVLGDVRLFDAAPGVRDGVGRMIRSF